MHSSQQMPPAPAEQPQKISPRERIVNDFSIQVATVNGSGSQTANLVLMRSIFQMGVPVSGKNLFPSNIQGLPTWFTIRASRDGYIARKKEIDFLVAMNPESAHEDVMSLPPGAAVLYDEPLKLSSLRSDLHFYSAPFDKLVAPVCPEAKLRKLVRNMIYVGILAELLGIDPEQIRKALYKQFGERKKKAADLNWGAVQAGLDYARANLAKQDPYFIEPLDRTAGKLVIEGNTAAALGCMFAGVTVCTWYPITPSSSLAEALITLYGTLPARPRNRQGDLRDRPGRGRAGQHRHGHWRRLGGRSRDDLHVGAGHLADVGVRRVGLLRGDPCRDH